MSAPLYFLPGVYRAQLIQGGRLSAAILAARGLSQIFGDVVDLNAELSMQELPGSGPGGTGGMMLVPLVPGAEPPVRMGYKPDAQEWTQIGDYWLGIDKESPPTPEDLVRRKTITGYPIVMGGQRWVVPILRRPDATTELPCKFGWDACGTFQESVAGEYRQLWEDTAEIVDLFLSKKILDMAYVKQELPKLVDWCVRILAVNYRFDRHLQTQIGAVDSEGWALLLSYAIDWPLAVALDPQKKTGLVDSAETESCEPEITLLGCVADSEQITAPVVVN